jgi:hypothetical protein
MFAVGRLQLPGFSEVSWVVVVEAGQGFSSGRGSR